MKLILQIVCAGIILFIGWWFYTNKETSCQGSLFEVYSHAEIKYTRFNIIKLECEAMYGGEWLGGDDLKININERKITNFILEDLRKKKLIEETRP